MEEQKMMRKIRTGLLTAIFICLMTMLFSGTFEAASTKRMTVYTRLIKKGNMVCCCIGGPYDDRCAIVAVDLRTGIAKRVVHYPSYLLLTGMMIKGDYLYFLAKGHDYDGNAYHLYRVNLSTGKKKCLVREISGYVIQGNKIYFRKTLKKNTFPYGIRGYKNMVMKSSGQAKKSTSVKALNKHKNTNASDYRILKEEAGKYIRFYLLKPTNEKIYMGQFEDEDYDEDEE